MAISRETYDNITKVHVEADEKTSCKELVLAQKEIRNHGRALAKIFWLGKSEGKKNKHALSLKEPRN